ncbi:MAG: hypothetical protein ACFHX7_08800 [Pseudomonadota bacterium]
MSVDGDWKVTMKSPMGAQAATLTLDTTGGALAGKLVGAQGTQEFSGGSAEGGALAWSINLTQPMPMQLDFSATVEGDSISGNVKAGAFGSFPFDGSRA